jgi:hypothetical protein
LTAKALNVILKAREKYMLRKAARSDLIGTTGKRSVRMNLLKGNSKYVGVMTGIFFALFLTVAPGNSSIPGFGIADAKISEQTILPDDRAYAVIETRNPQVQHVMDVQNRHNHEFLGIAEVVGTATGLTDDGTPAIHVYLKVPVRAGHIPERVEGVPVVVKVTGELSAMPGKASKSTPIFSLPVPIGVSTGNTNECSAGTIGARVKDAAGVVYALSNNHVLALENAAAIGDPILQPGLYDTGCLQNGNTEIGSLSQFVSINFGGSNTVDAAIAVSSPEMLGNATPTRGYGTPGSITVSASLNQAVQKYGRTSSLTRGTISGINATVIVNYGGGNATFVNQITVSSSKPFIKSGDSGSLLVTNNEEANPVGLLFAGSSSGQFGVANRIDDVLAAFGVTIDGK